MNINSCLKNLAKIIQTLSDMTSSQDLGSVCFIGKYNLVLFIQKESLNRPSCSQTLSLPETWVGKCNEGYVSFGSRTSLSEEDVCGMQNFERLYWLVISCFLFCRSETWKITTTFIIAKPLKDQPWVAEALTPSSGWTPRYKSLLPMQGAFLGPRVLFAYFLGLWFWKCLSLDFNGILDSL